MCKDEGQISPRRRLLTNLITDTNGTLSYINNALIPIVTRYANHPNLIGYEVINEPEGAMIGYSYTGVDYPVSQSNMQRFVAMIASAIHQNSSKMVTVGSACLKYNSDVSPSLGNFWKDSALQAVYNSTNAFLDFYQIHFYDWMISNGWNPFDLTRPTTYWKLDKPCLIGEFYGTNDTELNLTVGQLFTNGYANGYIGNMPWTYNSDWTNCNVQLKAFGDSHPEVDGLPVGTATISAQPVDLMLSAGQTASFTISANGAAPLFYQWQAGATNGGIYTNLTEGGQFSGPATTNLLISNVTSNNVGNYIVVVTNIFGSVTSSVATLVVIPPAPPNVNALACEPFSYPTGSLTNSGNAGGGTGWLDTNWSDPTIAPWSGNSFINIESAPIVVTPGLSYPNLLTSSNALSISTSTTLRAWNLGASGLFSQMGNSLWFSFLFSPGGTANKLNVMPLANTNTSDYTRGTGTQIFYSAGVGTVNPFIEDGGGSANDTYFTNSGPVLPASGTVFIAGKMTWNGATTSTTNDTLSVWLNPVPGTIPQAGSANSLTAKGVLDKGGWFVIRGGSTFVGQIDEVRVGTNYASVAQVIPPVTLNTQTLGANLQLTWSLGTLLQSTNLSGPWLTNPAASPYTFAPTNSQMFYRVRIQ